MVVTETTSADFLAKIDKDLLKCRIERSLLSIHNFILINVAIVCIHLTKL